MKIHIPTTQYGFIEAEVETVTEAQELSDEVTKAFTQPQGLTQRDFNTVIDRYLSEGTGETQTYLDMNNVQRGVIQEIKKSIKRIASVED